MSTSSITVSMATTIGVYLDVWLFKSFKSLQAEIASTTVGNKSSSKRILSLWLHWRHDIILSPGKISNRNVWWKTSCHYNIISPPNTTKKRKKKEISLTNNHWPGKKLQLKAIIRKQQEIWLRKVNGVLWFVCLPIE